MSVVRRIARPLIAATFVNGGLDQLRHPGSKADRAAPIVQKIAPALGLPNDTELLVRANGATMVGAGILFALGRVPRLAALALAATLAPTTVAGHAFWKIDDPQARAVQKLHFFKNTSMLGGLLLAIVDTDGKPGLSWRARRAARDTARTAKHAKREAKLAARTARREAKIARLHVEDALPLP